MILQSENNYRSRMSLLLATTGRTPSDSPKVGMDLCNCASLLIIRLALPSKPLNSIALYDADTASALSFVKQKLKDAGIDQTFTTEQTAYLERLGGRASDLESVSCVYFF
jgi:hypothetical protein